MGAQGPDLQLPEAELFFRVCQGATVLHQHLRVLTQLGSRQQHLRIVYNLQHEGKADPRCFPLNEHAMMHHVYMKAYEGLRSVVYTASTSLES